MIKRFSLDLLLFNIKHVDKMSIRATSGASSILRFAKYRARSATCRAGAVQNKLQLGTFILYITHYMIFMIPLQ